MFEVRGELCDRLLLLIIPAHRSKVPSILPSFSNLNLYRQRNHPIHQWNTANSSKLISLDENIWREAGETSPLAPCSPEGCCIWVQPLRSLCPEASPVSSAVLALSGTSQRRFCLTWKGPWAAVQKATKERAALMYCPGHANSTRVPHLHPSELTLRVPRGMEYKLWKVIIKSAWNLWALQIFYKSSQWPGQLSVIIASLCPSVKREYSIVLLCKAMGRHSKDDEMFTAQQCRH